MQISQVLKGHDDSKISMARIMLWILFIYMMVTDWRLPDRTIYQWEFMFLGLLTYVIGGKFAFEKFVSKKVPQSSTTEEPEESADSKS